VCACGAAYCKNALNDQWYCFDDHRVSKLRPDNVVTKSAYLLFYRRRLAQTRCAVSLQQWVSSVCSASYNGKMSDTTAHNQSGNVFSFVVKGILHSKLALDFFQLARKCILLWLVSHKLHVCKIRVKGEGHKFVWWCWGIWRTCGINLEICNQWLYR